jgi:hypothetical protein
VSLLPFDTGRPYSLLGIAVVFEFYKSIATIEKSENKNAQIKPGKSSIESRRNGNRRVSRGSCVFRSVRKAEEGWSWQKKPVYIVGHASLAYSFVRGAILASYEALCLLPARLVSLGRSLVLARLALLDKVRERRHKDASKAHRQTAMSEAQSTARLCDWEPRGAGFSGFFWGSSRLTLLRTATLGQGCHI